MLSLTSIVESSAPGTFAGQTPSSTTFTSTSDNGASSGGVSSSEVAIQLATSAGVQASSSSSPLSSLSSSASEPQALGPPAAAQSAWSVSPPTAAHINDDSTAATLDSVEPRAYAGDDVIATPQTLSPTSSEATGSAGEEATLLRDVITANRITAAVEQRSDTLESPVEKDDETTLHDYSLHPTPTLCRRTCNCKSTSTGTNALTVTDQRGPRREKQWAEDILQALTLDKRSLSSAVRRKRSVHDPRVSSAVLGVTGVLVIVSTVLVVCCMDFPVLLRDARATLIDARRACHARRSQMA